MNQNTNNLYFKIALVTLAAVIIGVIVGVINPTFPENPVRFLLTELVTCAVVLLVTGLYLLFTQDRQSKNCPNGRKLGFYLEYLTFGAICGFIISVIGLSLTITASLTGSVIIGIAAGFYALTLGAILLVFNYLIKNL